MVCREHKEYIPRALLLVARAPARCLSGAQCLPKREGHAFSPTATSTPVSRHLWLFRPPVSIIFRPSLPLRTVYRGPTANTRAKGYRKRVETPRRYPVSTLLPPPIRARNSKALAQPQQNLRGYRTYARHARQPSPYNDVLAKFSLRAIFRGFVSESRRALAVRGRVGSACIVR